MPGYGHWRVFPESVAQWKDPGPRVDRSQGLPKQRGNPCHEAGNRNFEFSPPRGRAEGPGRMNWPAETHEITPTECHCAYSGNYGMPIRDSVLVRAKNSEPGNQVLQAARPGDRDALTLTLQHLLTNNW